MPYLCPDCRKEELAAASITLSCQGCGARFPVLNDVPLLLPTRSVKDLRSVLATQLDLGDVSLDELNAVFLGSAAFAFLRRGLEHEFGNLRGRFAFLRDFPDVCGATARREQTDAPIEVRTAMLAPTFVPGGATTRSLRIRNTTSERVFATEGAAPYHLSYHLFDARGRCIVFDGERSPFPVPLEPGAELTIPLAVRAPQEPGQFRLHVALVQETVRWFDDPPAVALDITVGAVERPGWEVGLTGDFDYAADFSSSVDTLERAISDFEAPAVLELACGMYPLSAHLRTRPAAHHAMDLCYPELQLAALHHRRGNDVAQAIRFFCGDVDAMPFADALFDCVVICAALHHFPDPVATLRGVRRLLSPDGRLVVVREPCLVNPFDENYREQLRLGFNEQQFQPEEYDDIFQRAGFLRTAGRIDFGGSLKAILRRAPD